MGTAFAAAAATLFRSPDGVADAVVTIPASSPVATRAILSRRDEAVTLDGLVTGARNPGWQIRIPRATFGTRPPAGTTIAIGAATYTVNDVAEDPQQQFWICDAA